MQVPNYVNILRDVYLKAAALSSLPRCFLKRFSDAGGKIIFLVEFTGVQTVEWQMLFNTSVINMMNVLK